MVALEHPSSVYRNIHFCAIAQQNSLFWKKKEQADAWYCIIVIMTLGCGLEHYCTYIAMHVFFCSCQETSLVSLKILISLPTYGVLMYPFTLVYAIAFIKATFILA